MASLGFVRLMQGREGSGVLASVATLLVVHPGVRVTSSNSGFVGMVCVSNHPFECVWVARISTSITEIE